MNSPLHFWTENVDGISGHSQLICGGIICRSAAVHAVFAQGYIARNTRRHPERETSATISYVLDRDFLIHASPTVVRSLMETAWRQSDPGPVKSRLRESRLRYNFVGPGRNNLLRANDSSGLHKPLQRSGQELILWRRGPGRICAAFGDAHVEYCHVR